MVQNRAPPLSSHRCSPAREDQGTSWRGLAHCICSVGENKREFSVAFHPMFAPSLPGSAGTNGPTEPASSCPEGGLGPPLLCDDEDGAAYHVRILVGYCSNRGVPQHGGGQEAKASSTLPPQAHRRGPACKGILPGPPSPAPRVQPAPPPSRAEPWPWPCPTGRERTAPAPTAPQGSGTRPEGHPREGSSGFPPALLPRVRLRHC